MSGSAIQAPADDVVAVVREYYRALEAGEPLASFYATDAEAGELGPVVKIGSGEGEVVTGYDAVATEVERVRRSFARNRLESRGLVAHSAGQVGWFVDQVWWSGIADGQPFASLSRWTGVCRRVSGGWKLIQLHVSEGIS